jgi:hypothetical protein
MDSLVGRPQLGGQLGALLARSLRKREWGDEAAGGDG